MPQDIIARRNSGRNLDHPRGALSYKLVVAPSSRDSGIVNKTSTVNLEELELGLVHGLATT